MTYRLRFVPAALKEWEKLGAPVKNQLKKKLAERLENPRVPADKLSGYEAVYKIKPRSAGYHLVYEVIDDELFVYVLAVGKRDRGRCTRRSGRVDNAYLKRFIFDHILRDTPCTTAP